MEATAIEHYIRYGNIMTHVAIVTRPRFLFWTEPFIRTNDYALAQYTPIQLDLLVRTRRGTYRRPQEQGAALFAGREPFINEFAKKYGIPLEAAMGGAETMYPEYQFKIGTDAQKRRPKNRDVSEVNRVT